MDRSVRIAIADDEPVMQMYLEETLRALGHDVVLVAGNGRELIDLWPEHPADLVITDIKMPELDGLAAAREIYRRRVVPVVFITGYNRLEDVAREDIDLVHVYLVKPVGMEELRHAVDAALCLFDEFRIVLDEDGDPARALRNSGSSSGRAGYSPIALEKGMRSPGCAPSRKPTIRPWLPPRGSSSPRVHRSRNRGREARRALLL